MVTLLVSVVAVVSCLGPNVGPTHLPPPPPPPPPPTDITQIVVVPDTVTLDPAQRTKFAAYGRTARGDSAAVTVSWSATGGTISPDGTYQADTGVGDFAVKATSETLNLSGSSRVRVRRRGTLLQETFEDQDFASRGWYDNAGMATTTAQHVPGSTRALEVHFPAGGLTPTWGGAARHLFPETESVYLSLWVKYSATWVGSAHSYHPHEFLFLTNEDQPYTGPSFAHLTTYVEHNYQNGGVPVLGLQDAVNIDQTHILQDLTALTENRAAAGCNGNADPYTTGCYNTGGGVFANEKKFYAAQPAFMPNPGPGYKGDWHFVEAYFKLNSILAGKGVPDGIVRYWFDGKLVIEHTNVLLRTGTHPHMKFNQVLIAPYIGDGSPVDQTMWVDNLSVGTARP